MSDLFDVYATQARLIWDWRGGPASLVKRGVLTFVVATFSFAVTAAIVPGIEIDSILSAALAVILVGLFNALVRPVLLAIVAPWSLVAMGILVIVMQIVSFFVIAQLSPGVHVSRPSIAFVGSIVYTIINMTLISLFGIDRGGSYFGALVQMMRTKHGVKPTDKQGLVVLQIDGLAHPILAGRIRAGSVNTMAGWVRDGSHRLSRWEALLPSMTSASQLGILHGNNDGIPAFRWFERDRQKLMVSSNPKDAAEIVARASNGEGLLSNDGVSICNLVTGDAQRSYLTTAALAEGARGLGDSKAFYGFFLSPTGYMRALALFLGEFGKERYQAFRMRRRGVIPQLHRGYKYAGMRAASNVLLRDVNTSLIIEEMYRGANVIYADFTDYDEIAHHSGPERVEAFDALDGIDTAFATIAKVAQEGPRKYRIIVLSDHGQSLGATFKQRYGESLADLIRRLMGGRAKVASMGTHAEGSAFVNAFLSEVSGARGASGSVARRAFASRTTSDGLVDIDSKDDEQPALAEEGSIAVVGSGNLGLVYFTGHDHRLTLEELESMHPNLVASLAAHPGVSMVLVRSGSRGGVVIGARGARYLDDGRVEGEDPTEPFGPNTLLSLRREDAMKHAPDLLLISQYDPELGEVAAFEELIGSHGGLGGFQTRPFILHPSDWVLDEEVPLGAPSIYRNIRRWLSSIGIELGKQPAETTAAADHTPPVDSDEAVAAAT